MDVTWSVRMPEELKERISDMINESGLNSKDFITQIIQAYEIKSARKMQPLMDTDMEELSTLTGRLHTLFINLCERVTVFQKERDDEHTTKLLEKDDMLAVFNEKIKSLEEKLSQNEEQTCIIKKRYDELIQSHSQISEMCDSHKALILEYREKNDTLTGLLGEYKNFKILVESLSQELETEKQLLKTAESRSKEKELEITRLQKLIEENKNTADMQLHQKLEISNIEKEKEILALKKDFHQRMEIIQQQYTDKIKELLDAIEKMQKSGITKRSTSRISNSDD